MEPEPVPLTDEDYKMQLKALKKVVSGYVILMPNVRIYIHVHDLTCSIWPQLKQLLQSFFIQLNYLHEAACFCLLLILISSCLENKTATISS